MKKVNAWEENYKLWLKNDKVQQEDCVKGDKMLIYGAVVTGMLSVTSLAYASEMYAFYLYIYINKIDFKK